MNADPSQYAAAILVGVDLGIIGTLVFVVGWLSAREILHRTEREEG